MLGHWYIPLFAGAPAGTAVWPPAATVLAGVVYGPNGNDYTGSLALLTAAQVWSYAARDVNVVKVRGQSIVGSGTDSDPWGPA